MTSNQPKILLGLLRAVSPEIARCELTFLDREPIDYARAQSQQQAYRAALEQCGVRTTMLADDAGLPDACFVEDTAFVLDELAVIAHPGAASRRGETIAVARALDPFRERVFLDAPATLDGGDVLRIGRRLYVSRSSRTNAAAIQALSQMLAPLGYEVIGVPVAGSLHLKTACTAVDEETLLVNPRWISLDPFRGYRVIEVADDEPWAANILRIGETLLAQTGFPKTIDRILPHCPQVRLVDISEFRKAEAGLTCLSILFEK